MKRKIGFVFIILFCFLLAGFGGLVSNVAFADEVSADATAKELQINDQATFENLINNGSYKDYDELVLNCDINVTTPFTTTLGTEKEPFTGVFNGRGHKITGLNVNCATDIIHAGLFGVTDNATIKNLKLDGTITLQTSVGYTSYMGVLVALARNTKIENIDIDATKINFNTDFNSNLNFGILAGTMIASSADKVICRTSSQLGTYQINNSKDKEIVFGGIVGKLTSSQIHLGVTQTSLTVNVGADFDGDLKIGGIVGQTSDGSSEIINVAEDSTLRITNASSGTVNAGEVVGVISSPSPNQQGFKKNISYIHYKDNSGIKVFGDQGSYEYDESAQNNCNITSNLNNTFNTKEYFTDTASWDTNNKGIWDFDHDWYWSGKIENQAFLSDLQVQLSENLNTDVFEYRSLKVNGASVSGAGSNPPDLSQVKLRYGDDVELEFGFRYETYSNNLTNLRKKVVDYYELRELQVTSNYDVSSTYRGTIEMYGTNMRLSTDGVQGYQIVPNVDGDSNEITSFVLKIEDLSMYSSGKYNITMDAKTFSATLTGKLFKRNEHNVEEEISGAAPGYIYNAKGMATQKTSWQTDISYKAEYIPEAHTESVKPYYVFEGWYIDDEVDTLISTDNNLNLEIGVAYEIKNEGLVVSKAFITGDVQIYAKYIEQSRQIYFSIDNSSASSGVEKVVVIDGKTSQTLNYSDYLIASSDEEKSIYVNKDSTEIQMEIYIKKGYNFDPAFFAERNTVQGGYQCEINGQSVEDDLLKYTFTFTDLKSKDSEEGQASIPILITSKVEKDNNNSLMWIIIAGAGGVVLLLLIVLLIVFLVKRRGGGGGKTHRSTKAPKNNTYKSNKKDFKQMYY